MKYFLFLDECGNRGVTKPNLEFPIFVLSGILATDANYEIIQQEINKIKEEIWGGQSVIFHSRDIRKCQKEFNILYDPVIKRRFYDLINAAVINLPFTIIVSGLQKNRFIELLDKPEHDVYEIALSFVIEQAVTILQNTQQDNELAIIIEKRGNKEDKQLYNYFKRLCLTGTRYLSPVDLNSVNPGFTFRNKQENINGLQLADLVAYPIARHFIEPEKPNPAFEVLKDKIYRSNDSRHGLQLYP